ncbi:hypothetical protein HU200_042883 [Digitaria exilis]|uniref:Uncharacterized protein n=1 Tax=Digitaria exilis TaxID=1010633 RepID=A0A835EE49_9POAL|nr:hypothetical protein HU200_042883 [Digitaria exilis]
MAAEKKTKRSPSAVTVALLVLASCRASSSSPSPTTLDDDDPAAARGVEPVGYLASVASSVLAAYIASAATSRTRRRRLSPGALLAELRRTWARSMATALYIELLTAAMVLLLSTLGELLSSIAGDGSLAAGILAASGSVALAGWLGTVLFAHSDIACRMSLVVAAVEEEEEEEVYYEGASACVRRAEQLVAGHGVRGAAVGLVAGAIEQAPAWLCGDGAAPAVVFGLVVLAAKVVACCACAAFYYDCRRRHDSKELKVEGMTKGWQVDGCDVSDESEVEEFGFGSVFQCFRLT